MLDELEPEFSFFSYELSLDVKPVDQALKLRTNGDLFVFINGQEAVSIGLAQFFCWLVFHTIGHACPLLLLFLQFPMGAQSAEP